MGRIINGYPQVDIYKIGEKNEQTKIRTINDGFNVDMSYDYKQFYVERMFRDTSFMNDLKYEFELYDIPTDKWITYNSLEYSYSKPQRVSRNDYLYFIKGRQNKYGLWRIRAGKSKDSRRRVYDHVPEDEELIYDPPHGEYVYDFSISSSNWLRIDLLKVGEDPTPENIRHESIHLNQI
jgi:hypothetical protein